MSSKGRKKEGNDAEYFPTPSWCVHRLIERVQLPSGTWLEPCAGNGDIIHAVKEKREGSIRWHANELRRECEPQLRSISNEVSIGDFLKWDESGIQGFDVIITNPPFSLALSIIKKSLLLADYVVMLLRLNFIGSSERTAFFKEFMPDIYVIPERPSFDGHGADSIEYAWFVWGEKKSRIRPSGSIEVLANTPLEYRKIHKPLDQRASQIRLL